VGILNGEIIGWPHPCTGSYHEVSVTGLDWITERTCTTPGAFFHSFLSPYSSGTALFHESRLPAPDVCPAFRQVIIGA
jgi:hypothetical protein